MVFSSAIFLFIFLSVVFLGNLLIRPLWAKNLFLTAASLVFYAFGEPVYAFLMIASAAMNYGFGRGLAATERQGIRRFLLVVSVLCDLVILGTFKYAGFLVENINHIAGSHLNVPEIALPVGISFFTFQAMSYVIDVYRNRDMCQKSFMKVLLYISFFPQLIAGPIVRWGEIETQLDHRAVTTDGVAEGICRFVKGLAKKLLLANGLGQIADQVFDLNIGQYSMAVAWLGAICYALQIFYDFSGYSDMAIGLASMFGFHFQENFDHPYSAESIHGFWRRWHISLSSWFKEYVYIPLGGNRKGKARMIFNLFVVWSLTAVWHGAEGHFLIWGASLLLLLALEKAFLLQFLKKSKILSHVYLVLVVPLTWMAFAIADVGQLGVYYARMFPFFGVGETVRQMDFLQYLKDYGPLFLMGIVFSTPYPTALYKVFEKKWLGSLAVIVVLGLSLYYMAVSTNNPFLYFNF